MSGQESSSRFNLEGVEDVEEYIWVNEGDTSLPWDRFNHVFTLVQSGNNAFRKNHLKGFEEAINCYSRANIIRPNDSIILGNRCAAYIRISQFLRETNPSASEHTPVNALDPTIHAELALKDAHKLVDLKNHAARSYLLKANCLCLLEKYEMARDTILSGLQIDPFSNPLQALLRNIERTRDMFVERTRYEKPERTDDFDCTVCLKLLYEPITTPCGHSFCRSCLFQSMDRGNKCPLCRTVLFVSPRASPVSVTLNNIIQKNFPEEYAERKAEHESLTNFGNESIPLFVMDVVIPCEKYHLNIFEPRYRLMVRRIMEGNHRMGMVTLDPSTGSIADFACEVEITECEPLPDGRIFIEVDNYLISHFIGLMKMTLFLQVEGRRRFQILRSWDQDGYRVASVEWIQDVLPLDEPPRELQELTSNVAERTVAWLTRAKQAARQNRLRYEKLLSLERMMPSPPDPERFSFWLVTLTNRRPSEKLELLRLRDTRERISRGLIYMRTEEQGCRVQ